MKDYLKISAIIIVAFLIISSIYVMSIPPNCGKKVDTVIDKGIQINDNETDQEENNTPDNGNQGFTHTVFIEEATATWCDYCPDAAGYLEDMYKSGDYDFYYVSMIEDMNTKAHDRLYIDYNIFGFPTLFIDGGYKIVVGAQEKSVFESAVQEAELREVPDITVITKAEFINDTNEIDLNITIENNEPDTYNGNLKVYLTEIISRWVNNNPASDGLPKPYYFGFIDYMINQNISVAGKGNITISNKYKISDFEVPNLDPENIMIIGVVFNSNSVTEYANPPDENAFISYFADAANGTKLIQGGNLPPTVGIDLPEDGMIHLFGKPILKTIYKNTILIGKTTVVATAEDDSGISKVEFYIDGKLKYTDKESPYQYSFNKVKLLKRLVRQHTIKVIAYDDSEKTATANLKVITFLI